MTADDAMSNRSPAGGGRGDTPRPARGAREGEGEGRADEMSLLQLLNLLLRRRRLVVGTPLAVAFLLVAVSLVLPRSYTATASFTPQGGETQLSELAGLAAQFGIAVPTGDMAESPQFYVQLLRTRALLARTATTEYRFVPEGSDEPSSGDLLEILDIEGDTPAAALEEAVEELREDLTRISTDGETGVVEVSVSTRWPDLSELIVARMLELVNEFNVELRNSQAAAEREFTEERLAEAETALRVAEDSLEAFLQRNRRYQNSPELTFQLERLQRRVDLQQQVYTSLAQSYEQARIDEVRDTPIITVVDPPERPGRPDPRGLIVKAVLGLILGGALGVGLAFGREMLAIRRQTDPDDYAEFARLRRALADDLRRGWRRLRNPLGGGPGNEDARGRPGT